MALKPRTCSSPCQSRVESSRAEQSKSSANSECQKQRQRLGLLYRCRSRVVLLTKAFHWNFAVLHFTSKSLNLKVQRPSPHNLLHSAPFISCDCERIRFESDCCVGSVTNQLGFVQSTSASATINVCQLNWAASTTHVSHVTTACHCRLLTRAPTRAPHVPLSVVCRRNCHSKTRA
ncbi:uncharacterized protein LOC133842713 [Drosophila sulfurigaster albostrigata]|uniref:uncharacterized protein LOC133842713 n=1 Tax=Drosophila sulfurigaster albostrigata TaxID=89887 RepID=UPI002D219BF2|nr:uncharacterized protein LOC133842713 [Drosophila sulfurigaster albostrigata]